MEEKFTEIISAFPGCGKTECYKKYQDPIHEFIVLDSDSSTFDKTEFPENYIKHIKENVGKVDVIFISSHQAVRDALKKDKELMEMDDKFKCRFIIAYPSKEQKENYLERYKLRGSSDKFIKLLSDNWDNWIDSMQHETLGAKYLMMDSYLTDWVKSPHEIDEDVIKRRKDFQNLPEDEQNKYCSYCGCEGGCNVCQPYKKEIERLKEYNKRHSK